jgi:broad specificity phosphatase PhoE
MEQGGPERLWLVRHGQSAGNLARDAARAARLGRIDLDERDVDVDLSPLGEEQARLLGRWFSGSPSGDQPEVILSSPYVRAARTAQLIAAAGALTAPVIVDERLREREFGVLDGLTGSGIRELHPDQASARRTLGKFYYRPPGGESWCDVILRLRSVMDTLSLHQAGARVLIVTHQVVVLCLRYLLENLDEAGILVIDRQGDVLNCAITDYRLDPAAGRLALGRYNFACPQPAAPAS